MPNIGPNGIELELAGSAGAKTRFGIEDTTTPSSIPRNVDLNGGQLNFTNIVASSYSGTDANTYSLIAPFGYQTYGNPGGSNISSSNLSAGSLSLFTTQGGSSFLTGNQLIFQNNTHNLILTGPTLTAGRTQTFVDRSGYIPLSVNNVLADSTGNITIPMNNIPGGLQNFTNDAEAATGGIPVNGLYRNGSAVQIRVS